MGSAHQLAVLTVPRELGGVAHEVSLAQSVTVSHAVDRGLFRDGQTVVQHDVLLDAGSRGYKSIFVESHDKIELLVPSQASRCGGPQM